MINRVNDILRETANSIAGPLKKAPCRKLKWPPKIMELCKINKKMFHIWKKAGRKRDPNDTTFCNMKEAKRALRRAQRQLATSVRLKAYDEIMESSPRDQKVFYKLISKQRNTKRTTPDEMIIDGETRHGDDLIEGLATYFEKLATPKDHPGFDAENKKDIELKFQLLQYITKQTGTPIPEATDVMIYKAIHHLKNSDTPFKEQQGR
jgi:hypothetical protein